MTLYQIYNKLLLHLSNKGFQPIALIQQQLPEINDTYSYLHNLIEMGLVKERTNRRGTIDVALTHKAIELFESIPLTEISRPYDWYHQQQRLENDKAVERSDLDSKIKRLEYRSLKNKWLYGIAGFVGGVVSTNIQTLYEFIRQYIFKLK